MAKPEDKSGQPFTLDDLDESFTHYRASKGKWDGHMLAMRSAKSAMESHQREADKEREIVDRYRAELKKKLGNLEDF